MTMVSESLSGIANVTAEEILASHFTLVSQPGAIEPITLEGAEGWTSPNPHPALSLMRWTTTDPEVALSALNEVVASFRAQGRGFDWMTGPRCADSGLLPLLEAEGFVAPPLTVAAMAKAITPHDKDDLPESIRIWKVEDVKDRRIWSIMSRGFDVSDDVGEVFHNAYLTPSPLQRSDVYAAALDDRSDPVGVGYLSYIGEGPSVLLRVSSTLEDSRGRGIYRALVVRRLRDAAQTGRTQAFVHAYSLESQSILEALGFETVGTLLLHRWRP